MPKKTQTEAWWTGQRQSRAPPEVKVELRTPQPHQEFQRKALKMNESGRSTLSLEDKIEDLDHINKSHKKLKENKTQNR